MRLINFSDVHPDWAVIGSLEPKESRSLLELLVTTVLIDGRVTEDEREAFMDSLARLPLQKTDIDNDAVQAMFETASERLRSFSGNPDAFESYLDRTCTEIADQDKRLASFRMLAMMCVSDGLAENEFDLARAIGHRLEINADTVENILKSTWESRQAYIAETDPNVERDPKPVRSARHFEDHDMSPDQRPFTYDGKRN